MKNINRPNIFIDNDKDRVIAETIAALAADPYLYQRGGMLVRVIRHHGQCKDGIVRCEGSPIIQIVSATTLRTSMMYVATFTKLNNKGKKVAVHPPQWLVNEIHDGKKSFYIGESMDISGFKTSGHDEQTGVLFRQAIGASFDPIRDDVNINDAAAALTTLFEVICDFPFESEEHKAAWLAALFTPLARSAFTGPSPLFLIESNSRGVGKNLLAQTIAHIVSGGDMSTTSYTNNNDKMLKKITSIAIAGDRMILLDNLKGEFGNYAIDRVLTSTKWDGRIPGKNKEIDLPLLTAWYATGSNVRMHPDTAKRVVRIRLNYPGEYPEERSGFKHENLLDWIDENRGRLVSAALTILSAYLKQGHNSSNLGWSSVVRGAVVWVGLPDPCNQRRI